MPQMSPILWAPLFIFLCHYPYFLYLMFLLNLSSKKDPFL